MEKQGGERWEGQSGAFSVNCVDDGEVKPT